MGQIFKRVAKGLTLLVVFVVLLAVCSLYAYVKGAGTRPVPTQLSGNPAQGVFEKQTFTYATRESQELLLDRIVDSAAPFEGRRPVIIFSVGGGWETAVRYDANSEPFFQFLASLGYVVVTIDYRLGMKQAKALGELTEHNGVDMYLRAIRWGVEDLYDATAFVLEQADAWNIDPQQIVIIGSSAGATNSLVAEYNLANSTELARAHLPSDFRYAGVVSMAGAFWLPADTPLAFSNKPAPILFFHGPKDQLVTYDEVQEGFSGYGPAYFMRAFAGPEFPKWFIEFEEGDHIVSFAPMVEYRNEITAFLQKFVRERQALSIHSIEQAEIKKQFLNLLQLYGGRITFGNPAENQEAEGE